MKKTVTINAKWRAGWLHVWAPKTHKRAQHAKRMTSLRTHAGWEECGAKSKHKEQRLHACELDLFVAQPQFEPTRLWTNKWNVSHLTWCHTRPKRQMSHCVRWVICVALASAQRKKLCWSYTLPLPWMLGQSSIGKDPAANERRMQWSVRVTVTSFLRKTTTNRSG